METDFADAKRAMDAFDRVTNPTGRQLLYDHAKEQFDATEKQYETMRDKAKLLLGSASLTVALMSASLTLVRDWYKHLPILATIGILVLFFWTVLHFLRSLILSIQAITRNSMVAVSTQQVIGALAKSDSGYLVNSHYLHLAANLRAATAQTRQLLNESTNRVILAQTSFRWGLTLLPLVFGLSFFLAVYAARIEQGAKGETPMIPPAPPAMYSDADIVKSVAQIEKTLIEIASQLSTLAMRLESLIVAQPLTRQSDIEEIEGVRENECKAPTFSNTFVQ